MKKFLLMLAMAASAHFTSTAGPGLAIINNTNCTVTYHLYGSDGSTCFPTGSLTTNTYTLAPMSNIVFTDVSVLNGCGPAPFWNIICTSCSLGAPCTCAVANGPTGSWDAADIGLSGSTPFGQLGGVNGNTGSLGTCGSTPVTVDWVKAWTGDVNIMVHY